MWGITRIVRFLGVVKGHKHPAKYCLALILLKLKLSSLFLIRQDGFVLRFFPTALSTTLWINPADRCDDEGLFRKYLRPGDTVIDVGANIGQLTLTAAVAVGPAGKVLAIEPHPEIFGYLCRNVALNGAKNTQTSNNAIGERDGCALLSSCRSDDLNAIASANGIEVPMRRLDGMSNGLENIALLKVDVEGYERFVLLGATLTLTRTRCIYFESWEEHFAKYGYSLCDIAHFLAENGFWLYKAIGGDLFGPVAERYQSDRCENLLALRTTDEFLARTGFRLRTWQECIPPSGPVRGLAEGTTI